MKKLTIIITAILLCLNLLFGILLDSFKPFNVGFTSIAIMSTGTLVYLLQVISIKDAYAISLVFFYSIIGIIHYVLGLFSPTRITGNWFITIATLLMTIEIVVLIVCKHSSNY